MSGCSNMSLPTKYYTNVYIDSRDRASGTPSNLRYVLSLPINVPQGTRAFLVCTRWLMYTGNLTSAERRGQSVQLWMSDIDRDGAVIDMSDTLYTKGVPLPCIAYNPGIWNPTDYTRVSSLSSHPVLVPAGLNLRGFDLKIVGPDGTEFTKAGEWQAEFLLTVTTMPPGQL